MCSVCRWIDWPHCARRAAAMVARGLMMIAACFLAVAIAQPWAILVARADDYPRVGNANLPSNVSVSGQPVGASSTLQTVQQATHLQPEPARFAAAANDKAIPLPAQPHDSSGEKYSSGPRPLGAIISVVGSLAVVLGLFFGMAWLMRRSMPNSVRRLPPEAVEVLGRTPLGGRQQMHLLRFGNKMLLVCVSPTGVEPLGEITDPVEIDRLGGLCAQTESTSASTTFKQIFGQLTRDKSAAAANDGKAAFSALRTRRASTTSTEVSDA
jgi:flagellar biogenesis protein FliO